MISCILFIILGVRLNVSTLYYVLVALGMLFKIIGFGIDVYTKARTLDNIE